MPEYWYSNRGMKIEDGDDPDVVSMKEFNRSVSAERKPYFMIYIYPSLKKEYKDHVKNGTAFAARRYFSLGIKSIKDLQAYESKTDEMMEILDRYNRYNPIGENPCVINRICWIFEKEFKSFKESGLKDIEFDYSILRGDTITPRKYFNDVSDIYNNYTNRLMKAAIKAKTEKADKEYFYMFRLQIQQFFRSECSRVCTNSDDLCDVILDMCYTKENSKQFVWDVVGDVLLKRLANKDRTVIHYPIKTDDMGEFMYAGNYFNMAEHVVAEEYYDYSE